MRTWAASLLLGITFPWLAACQPDKGERPRQTGESKSGAGAMVIVHSQQEPDSLNRAISDMVASTDATTPIMSGLITVNDRMEYIPDLAVAVPTVENGGVKLKANGMVVTYQLKQAKFHDGQALTSADVKFSWEVYMDPAVQVSSRDGYDKISKIETPDPQTVVVHFKTVYGPYLNLFGAIFPRHLLEADRKKHDKPGDSHFNHAAWNRQPIGSGPFKFKEWVSGDHISYEANPEYYGTKPKLAGLIMRIVPDENTAFVQLKSGDLDIYQHAALTQYEQLKALSGIVLHETPSLSYEHVDFNLQNPRLQDLRVRQAIALAVNKREISQRIYKGLYPPAYSDQSPLSYVYNSAVESKYPFDPAKARQLLDAAGWQPGSDGIRSKAGQRLSFKITSTTGRKPRELTEQVLMAYLKAIGIELQIDNVPGPKLFGRPDGLLHTGNYDLALYAWVTSPDPNNIFLWNSRQLPPNGQNYTRYRNPEVDKLTVLGNATVDRTERSKIYQRLQEILADELPSLPLLFWTTLDAVNTRVKGFKPNPTSAGNFWNCQEWYVVD
ncbi:MAG: peptide ABC transporter substrate-binding protein [Cyanobacteria bacterium NC_groundwater_1444_Ag_S-0.65um_54_12]|nr:peptide ABC transporter substrate-binding protein [Cyanobacteria bacterium NC_groundwater_1444_Ag_S-0.65um_54_12]